MLILIVILHYQINNKNNRQMQNTTLPETIERDPILIEPVLVANQTPIEVAIPLMDWIGITMYSGYILPLVAGKDFDNVIDIINRSIKYN